MRTRRPEPHTLAGAYALDALTGTDRARFEWHLARCEQCAHEIGGLWEATARLASVRTLAYVANRPDWLADPPGWQAKTHTLEDRLSDRLHEKLMARFVDRRTSALMRGLRVREEMLAGIGANGAVTVEGHYVGKLTGLPDFAESAFYSDSHNDLPLLERVTRPVAVDADAALAAEARRRGWAVMSLRR